MKTITIEVTQDDIDKGGRKACTMCPVARAVLRTFGTDDFFVGTIRIRVENLEFQPPSSVIDFWYDFFMRKPVEPFTFIAELTEIDNEILPQRIRP